MSKEQEYQSDASEDIEMDEDPRFLTEQPCLQGEKNPEHPGGRARKRCCVGRLRSSHSRLALAEGFLRD